MQKKIVVAITGASGSIYAEQLLLQLLELQDQYEVCDIVASDNAVDVMKIELGYDLFEKLPFKRWGKSNFMAPFASGSAGYTDMVIIPSSMGAMGRIASGTSDDLISRSADVMLKERRNLILAIRDTPYNLIHIRNMETITLAGGTIVPCSPSFYSNPKDFSELARTVTSRIIDLIGLDQKTYRWGVK